MSLSDISKYFTTKILDDIIQKIGGTSYTSWEFGDGFKKGDSYLSEVFRLKINGINHNTGNGVQANLIVKAIPKNRTRRKLLRSADFFRNEINFYTKVLPAYEKFQKKCNATQPFDEYPKHFASHSDGENDFIALEDVSTLGYGPASRQDTVDVEHCSLMMAILGRFHAISLVFKDQSPDEFQNVVQSIEETYYIEALREWYDPFLKDTIYVANDAISKEYPGTIYEEKTKKFTENDLYSKLIRLITVQNKYSVIGHGDCWTPNFLIRYDETIPKDVKIIDFQLARYGSPAIDLSSFIYSCTDNSMREKHYNQMLKVYHEAASVLIKDLGSDPEKIFPYSALENELKEVGQFGCGMAMESLPLSMKNDDDVIDLDQLSGDNAILTDVLKISPLPDQASRLRIADTFKHAVDMGYIN